MTDMTKGIKLSISIKGELKSICACSECFNEVKREDRYCWKCGCVFEPMPYGGGIDYAKEQRDEYRKDEKTGWEDEDSP